MTPLDPTRYQRRVYYTLRSAGDLNVSKRRRCRPETLEKRFRCRATYEQRRCASIYGNFWGAPFTEHDRMRAGNAAVKQVLGDLVAGRQGYSI